MEKATFAAGCFWGIEAAFAKVEGVESTAVGYTGGWFENPTYEDICSDGTGHAEAVEVSYDPGHVEYETLLKLFWKVHDPTQLNRQGLDYGTQYRSAIFYHTPEQKRLATASLERMRAQKSKEVVTEITGATHFYKAEEYHQKYLEKRSKGVC